MIRRRLFLYTILVIAGILAAYMALDKQTPFFAVSFLVSVIFALQISLNRIGVTWESQRKKCMIAISWGMMILTIAHMGCQTIKSDELSGIKGISGQVINVRLQENKAELYIRVDDVNDVSSERSRSHDRRIKLLFGDTILCRIYDPDESLRAGIFDLLGVKIELSGKLVLPECKRNPRGFDYSLYLKGRGIHYLFTVKSLDVMDRKAGLRYRAKRWMLLERERFIGRFDNNGAFIRGVLFGDKSYLDEETYEEFSANGTAHILAVSGLHIGFIYGVLKLLTRLRRTAGMSALIVLVLLLYGELTLWNVSTVRSVIITVIAIASFHLNKTFDLLSAVATSAIMMLTLRPYLLFSSGFQMSYLAVTGIAFAAPALKPFLGEFFSFITSVQLVMMPYTMFVYHKFVPLSLIINLPVVFVASMIVPLAFVAFAMSVLLGWIPQPVIDGTSLMSELVIRLNGKMNPGGVFTADVVSWSPAVIMAFYCFGAVALSELTRTKLIRHEAKDVVCVIFAVLIPIASIAAAFDDKFADDEFVFIDVGQGDAIHVRTSNSNVLFDGGGVYDRNIGKQVLKPYFLSSGVGSLDAVVFSHLHMDHAKGAIELSESFRINGSMVSEIYRDYPDLPRGSRFLRIGDNIKLDDDVSVEVVWPMDHEKTISTSELDENEYNMVVIVDYRGIRVMLTGDLLAEDELAMVEYYRDRKGISTGSEHGIEANPLKCDVLEVAHHGSRSSSTDKFLDMVDPSIAIIQCGKNNLYGHPHQETLDKLQARGIKVLRTDECGAIGLDIRRGRIIIDQMLDE